MTMTETFTYAMAHHLPTFPEGHKCRRVHGHTCHLHVTVEVEDNGSGYSFDHSRLRDACTEIVRELDHHLVNDVAPELEDGLAESQLRWFEPKIRTACGLLGATLLRLDHDEDSSNYLMQKITHRKSLA